MSGLLVGDFFIRLYSERFLIGVLLLGLIVRMGLMPFTMQVDERFTGDIASFPRQVQLWNSPEREIRSFLYPPLFYYTLSVYLLHLADPFLRELWDKPISGPDAQFNWIASPFVFRNLFVLKAWYLLPDFGVAFLLWQLYRRRPDQQGRVALLAWVFNPLVIYTAYLHGQYDLAPVFFVMLSLWAAWKKRPIWAAFWMGIGACYKNYPFVFLPPLALILVKDWRDRFKMLAVGILPYILFFIPAMKNYASIGNFFSGYFFVASLDLGFGARIYFFLAFYAVLLWYLYYRQPDTFEDLWRVCFAILLVYYQFSSFDLHYWVWAAPFIVIYWVERRQEAKPFYLVIGLCLLALLTLTPRLLSPISPRFFLRLPSLLDMLTPYLPVLFIINIVRSLLAGTCFYMAWKLVRTDLGSLSGMVRGTPDQVPYV
jgi:hypothetical protein